ncbi:MAG: hypothetical protein IIC29_08960 [Chloroflexi bacterium]|nr:hypothetical protein [Chloroflexota bacterium]
MISGKDRAMVLDAHRQAEALTARAGFRARRRSEPFTEFADAAISAGLPAGASLHNLASLAGRAAYRESLMDRDAVQAASAHVAEIRLAFANVDLARASAQADPVSRD